MKPPPAVQVTLERFGPWRAASALVGAAALVCALEAARAWVPDLRALPPALLLSAAALLGAGVGFLGARQRSQRLTWNGHGWLLHEVAGPASGPVAAATGIEPRAGSVRLMIDLGFWMLLRFDGEAGLHRHRRWLPTQRGGLEPAWHALRCALIYSAPSSSRPASDPRPQ